MKWVRIPQSPPIIMKKVNYHMFDYFKKRKKRNKLIDLMIFLKDNNTFITQNVLAQLITGGTATAHFQHFKSLPDDFEKHLKFYTKEWEAKGINIRYELDDYLKIYYTTNSHFDFKV